MMTSKEIRLADYLEEDCILCGLETETRDSAIDQLVGRLHRKLDGFDPEAALEAVLERERQSPTVLAEGLALPHARLAGLAKPVLALATSHAGIDFEAVGEEPVHVIVLILTPKDDPGAYLRLMASLSRTLAEPHMIKRLTAATDARVAHGILTEGSEQLEVMLNASNVMSSNPVTLDESDTLAVAIQAFCGHRIMDIPIVDSDGDLRGGHCDRRPAWTEPAAASALDGGPQPDREF
jgi:PTS system nitrogen regulatory IIA component